MNLSTKTKIIYSYAGILLSGDSDGRAFDAIRGLSVTEAETEEDLIKRLHEWKDNMENRGMRCGVCGRGVGNNSIQTTSCHKKCSGMKGSMYSDENVCRDCMNPVTGTGCTNVDIGVNANVELADKFCYLDDMLSVDGDADAAVETRI